MPRLLRGPASAAANDGTELRERRAGRSPSPAARPPGPARPGPRPARPSRPGLAGSGRRALPPSAARLGGAGGPGSPGKLVRGRPAAGSREPRSLRGAPGLVAPLLEEAWREGFCSELVTVAGWRLLPHYAPGLLVCEEADGGEVGSGEEWPDLNSVHLSPPTKGRFWRLRGSSPAPGGGASRGRRSAHLRGLRVPAGAAPSAPAFPAAAAPRAV